MLTRFVYYTYIDNLSKLIIFVFYLVFSASDPHFPIYTSFLTLVKTESNLKGTV